MLDGPRDSSNDYRPENSPPSNTFKKAQVRPNVEVKREDERRAEVGGWTLMR